MNLHVSGSILVAALVASLTGCVVDKDTDSDTGTGTPSESSTGPTTSGSSTTGVGATATSSDDTGLPTSGATTEAGTTTDAGTTGGSADLQGSCEAACMVFLECQPGAYPDLATCAAACVDGAAGGPGCEAAATAFNTCIGGFDCEQLARALEREEFGACTEAFMAYEQSCGG